MAITHQDTNVNSLVINKLTKQEYDNLQQVSDTELYLVEEQVDSTVTQGSTNPVQSGAVYEALQDIGSSINDGTTWFIKNNQTIGTTSANQENDKTIAIPNDVEMVYFAHSKALSVQTTDAYYDTNYNYLVEEDPATWTDPNPQHRITTDGYYYDLSTDNIYQVNNYETTEVTSNVTIQGDTHKLYCDVDDNKLYRYDGSNFVALTSEGKTYTLSSNNENIRLTDSDGQTQDLSLSTLINGLSIGNSEPQDDDYIISQYVNGGTAVNTYHRRPLSKFWNWIKTKLGIGTNDGTFLRKDGTWATPTATDDTKVAKAGDTMTGTLILAKTQDASGNANNKPALIVGGTESQQHIEIDSNEIIAKSNGTSGSTLYLNDGYGTLGLCGSDYTVQNPTKFMKAITNDNIGTGAQFVLTITSNWGRCGYSTIAQIQSLVNTWRPLGTGATDAAAGNHTHTAREVGAVSTAIKTFSGTGYTAIQIGPDSSGIVIISFAYKPTSSTVNLPVTGTYKAAGYFHAGNRDVSLDSSAVFQLTAAGFIQNVSSVNTGVTYYGTVTSIRIS